MSVSRRKSPLAVAKNVGEERLLSLQTQPKEKPPKIAEVWGPLLICRCVLSVICILRNRCRDCGMYRLHKAAQYVTALAGGKPGGEQPIIDLPRDGEAIEGGGRNVQPCVGQAIGCTIDIRFLERNHPVAVLVYQ